MNLRCSKTGILPEFWLATLCILACGCGGASHPVIPPPQAPEFVYVANQGGNSISGFEIDSTGQLTDLPGSPFQLSFQPISLLSDPRSRFLLVGGGSKFVPAAINAAHTLTLTSSAQLSSGFSLMDPGGRFFFDAGNNFSTDTPIHVYSVAADLSFPEVPGSPFESGIRPAAIDPAGKFIFGFSLATIDTLQIAAMGALTKTASAPAPFSLLYAYVHPSGRFLYVQHLNNAGDADDIQVYQIDSAGGLTAAASETNFAPGKSFFFVAIHPSGKFLFSQVCTNMNPACELDTLTIDLATGSVNPVPTHSLPVQWSGFPASDSTGSRLFGVSGGSDCTVPGVLTVLSVDAIGRVKPTGSTAQTGGCPGAVVVTQ